MLSVEARKSGGTFGRGMFGRIIFLNGTSSAGKSTLATALRDALPDAFCYYASDQLCDAGFRTRKMEVLDVGQPNERDRFFDGFHRSIRAFADAGNDLVVEHIIEERSWANQLADLLAHLDVFWIGVHAPVEVLEHRERERGDRTIGEARYHLKTHDFCSYDLEVNSTDQMAKNVKRIVDAWRHRSRYTSQP